MFCTLRVKAFNILVVCSSYCPSFRIFPKYLSVQLVLTIISLVPLCSDVSGQHKRGYCCVVIVRKLLAFLSHIPN